MASYMTSTTLIASIKRRAMLPSNQATFQPADFLAFADEEMNLGLVPSVMKAHEDYFLYTQVVELQPNTTRYAIPYRAIGNKLREVAYQDGNGNVFEMTRIGIGDLPYYNQATSERAYAFYIENNEVVLTPSSFAPAPNTFIRLTYYIRPNSLVPLDQVAVITSVDRTTGVVQLSNLPSAFSVNMLLDLIKVQSPNKTLNFDITPMSINSTSKTITFELADIPANLAPGDHVCLAQECAVPQIPSDLHVVLAHRVAARCLEALGDTEGLATANQKLGELEAQMEILIDNRVDDAPRKVFNRHSTLRGGLSTKRRRF